MLSEPCRPPLDGDSILPLYAGYRLLPGTLLWGYQRLLKALKLQDRVNLPRYLLFVSFYSSGMLIPFAEGVCEVVKPF